MGTYARRKRQAMMLYHEDLQYLSGLPDSELASVVRFLSSASIALSEGEKVDSIPPFDGFAQITCRVMLEKLERDHREYVDTCNKRSLKSPKGDLSVDKSPKGNQPNVSKHNVTQPYMKPTSSSVGFFDDDDEAFVIQQDHNEILDAAERVGLASNDFERDDLIGLYAEHGKPAILAALDQYGKHKGKSIAYLRAILAGGPKKQTSDDPNADYFATAVRL